MTRLFHTSITIEKDDVPIGFINRLWINENYTAFETDLIRFDRQRVGLAFERDSVFINNQKAPLSIKIANSVIISSVGGILVYDNLWFTKLNASRQYTDEFTVIGISGPLYTEKGLIRLEPWQIPVSSPVTELLI